MIRKGKILIFFIILGAKPTSTLGPKRDQLVFKKFIGSLCLNSHKFDNSWLSKLVLKKTSCEIFFFLTKKTHKIKDTGKLLQVLYKATPYV